MVPLLVRLVSVQLPVRFRVQPFSIATTALSLTAVPPPALSMMLMVPVKVLPFYIVIVSVEMVSTMISPASV